MIRPTTCRSSTRGLNPSETSAMTDFRKEADGLGGAEVRADKLWGAQIQPLFKHFSFGKDLVPREIISAYVILKKAAANANHVGKRLDDISHSLIVRLADGILNREHQDKRSTGRKDDAGPQGSTGPIGITGEFNAGPQGPTGPIGPTGEFNAGPQGPTGPIGPTGEFNAGPQGPTGPVGPTGEFNAGPQGPTGPIGPTGEFNAGPQGPTGPIGPTGEFNAGPQGPTGPVGPTGEYDAGLVSISQDKLGKLRAMFLGGGTSNAAKGGDGGDKILSTTPADSKEAGNPASCTFLAGANLNLRSDFPVGAQLKLEGDTAGTLHAELNNKPTGSGLVTMVEKWNKPLDNLLDKSSG
jgi:hypothetical protein